jgi:3-hydroxyisobutyrate dehydrogenase
MGLPMVERLLKAGHRVAVWNRTRAKAEPLIAKGAVVVDQLGDLADADVLFVMVSTGRDLHQVCFGEHGLMAANSGKRPKILVDCSSIGLDESTRLREKLTAAGVEYISAPVSGNGKCVVAGKLSAVASGPKVAFEKVEALIKTFAVRGVSYVGEGELARICKIAHNVMLGVVSENLMEIVLLAQKAGVPRHAFLKFMNDSVMGSIFTQYKSPALVNLDWTTTFTPTLLRKDLDLGLQSARELGVPMPLTAAAREVLQMHIGMASKQADPEAYVKLDLAAMLETLASFAGIRLESEAVKVPSGLEVE